MGIHFRLTSNPILTQAGTVILIAAMMLAVLPVPLAASPGSYSLDWSAACPSTQGDGYAYPRLQPSQLAPIVGGRAADPLSHAIYGSPKDAVESLEPRDMALGQIVPFELLISVDGSITPENGSIVVTPYFLTKTTNGGDFGFDPAYGIYGAFVDSADSATVNGAAAQVDSYTWAIVNQGTSNEQIQGAIPVSGLQDGDTVVVEIWVVLKTTIPTGTQGNVQTGMVEAHTAAVPPDVINVGNQTIPLSKVQQFFTAEADLSIVKTDEPDPVLAGSAVTYQVSVTNNSSDTVANGVVVTDNLDTIASLVSAVPSKGSASYAAGVITWSVGSLDPGQTATMAVLIDVSTTFSDYDTSELPESGGAGTASKGDGQPPRDMVNNVAVTAITADPDTADNSYYQPTNVVALNPSLNVTKTAAEDSVDAAGDVIHYTIRVQNTGNQTLTGVTVADSLVGTLTRGADDPGNDDAYLEVGETWTYTGTYIVTQADIDGNGGGDGDIDNTVTADSNETPEDTASDTVLIAQLPSLNVTKTAAEDSVDAAGDVIHYTIRVQNTGNQTLTGVTVADSLVDLTGVVPVESKVTNGVLDVGETWTWNYTYTVTQWNIDSHGGCDGDIDNTATVGCDQLPPVSDSAAVPIDYCWEPAMSVTKTAIQIDAAGNGVIDHAGEIIRYQVSATNTGNQALWGITINDSLVNLKGVAAVESKTTNRVLDVGETWTWTYNYSVTQWDIDSHGGCDGDIDNTATVDCNQLPPVSDSAAVPIDYCWEPAMSVTKTATEIDVAGNGVIDNDGEVITYRVVATNTGNQSLWGITLDDSLVGLTGIVPVESKATDGVLDVGETWTWTYTYAVTQEDIDSHGGGDGDIDNTATVDCNQLPPMSDSATVPIDSSIDSVDAPVGADNARSNDHPLALDSNNSSGSDTSVAAIAVPTAEKAGPTEAAPTEEGEADDSSSAATLSKPGNLLYLLILVPLALVCVGLWKLRRRKA